jgi:hypothetical protein
MVDVTKVEQVKELVENLQDLQEGFVVLDKNNNRVKIKSHAYLQAHLIRGEGLTEKRALSLILANDHEEYLSYFEEDRKFFEPLIAKVRRFKEDIDLKYLEVCDIEDQKTFALSIKGLPYSGLLFEARKTGLNPSFVLVELPVEKQVRHFI